MPIKTVTKADDRVFIVAHHSGLVALSIFQIIDKPKFKPLYYNRRI
jgi:hypothetical protein